MALFKCEACGAALEVKEGSKIAFCPYCGMKQTWPKDPVQVLSDGTTAESLLKRGFMLLEEEEYKKAGKCFDRVLNIDPENGRAHLGRLMAFVKANDEYELEWQLKHKDDEPDKWEKFGKADTLLGRALEFSPEAFHDMFEDDYDKAVNLMNEGNYEAAAIIFEDISPYYPEALNDEVKCFRELGTTREAVIAHELDEHKRASNMFLEAWKKAQDLLTESFEGYGAEDGNEELLRSKEEIFSVVDLYIGALEIYRQSSTIIKINSHQYGHYYNDFAFNVNIINGYLKHSYIDYVKADNEAKRKFLEDIYERLNEAYKYIEANDTYNKEGSDGYKYREELRQTLKEYEKIRNDFSPDKQQSPSRRQIPKSSIWYYVSIFVSGAFLLWVLIMTLRP